MGGLGLDPGLADHPLSTIQHHRWKEGHIFTLTPAKPPELGINVQWIGGWSISLEGPPFVCRVIYAKVVYPNRQ